MKKRIFFGMVLLTVISLVTVAITLSGVFYWQFSSSVQREVRERALLIKNTVAKGDYTTLAIADMRLTLIAPNGVVLYDDEQDAAQLPNHMDRDEVRQAMDLGVGESRRFSDTLGQETYYYAIRLNDQSVLRLAKSTSSIWGMFAGALPVVIIVVFTLIIIGYLIAGKLTKQIVAPINMVDMEAPHVLPPYDELAPFVQMISRQREHIARQMTELKERADTISAIMDSMKEGLILVSPKGDILSVNKSAVGIFDIGRNIIGKNILEVLRNVELNEHMRSALSGIRSEIDFVQDNLSYRVYFSPVVGRGAVILFLDVTEKTMAERLRKEFSANVSHELKTPLTTIYGNVEMLESNMIKEEDKQQFYRKIKDEAARLIALIEDIMLLSQLDEDGPGMMLENIDLAATAHAVIASLQSKAEEQNIIVRVSGSGALLANHSQMTELFYNLIDNGIKYNKPFGKVDVEINSDENHATIALSDSGIGIPKEAQSRIFERFYRVDQSRSKKTGGTGLGLAIVKHIVAVYHGSVEVQSVIGEGSIITVTLYAQKSRT